MADGTVGEGMEVDKSALELMTARESMLDRLKGHGRRGMKVGETAWQLMAASP